jgi:hypothetical protein
MSKHIIESIQNITKRNLVSYVTNTRTNKNSPIDMSMIRPFYEHLAQLDHAKGLDLMIHTNGGDGIVPWRLVSLIRDFTDDFNVIIPYSCFSAGTLIALGANNIFMGKMGMMGPTDASVSNFFNPIINNQIVPISVEDVSAYISFVKDDFGITHEDELVEGLKSLTDKIHPLSLGNIKRQTSQSRMMAEKLLKLHYSIEQEHKIKDIVEKLTSKSYYHGHPINRKEAKEDIGLNNVINLENTLEDLYWNLYLEYENIMKLNIPWNINEEFSIFEKNSINDLLSKNICTYDSNTSSLIHVAKDDIPLAIIESYNLKHNLVNDKILKAVVQNTPTQNTLINHEIIYPTPHWEKQNET